MTLETQPLISIIIPCYNQSHFLEDCLKSIADCNTYPIEVLVVDDGSELPVDEIHFLKFDFASKLDIKVFRKENGGLSSARNYGLSHAKGKYIQFLDADDCLISEKFKIQMSTLESQGDLLLSISNYFIANRDLSTLTPHSDNIKKDLRLSDILLYWERGISIPIHSGLFRSSFIKGIKFNENVSGKEDWIFWANVFAKINPSQLHVIDEPLVIYRMHDSSMTKMNEKMMQDWKKASLFLSNQFHDVLKENDQLDEFNQSSAAHVNNYYLPIIRRQRLLKERIKSLLIRAIKKNSLTYSIIRPLWLTKNKLAEKINTAKKNSFKETAVRAIARTVLLKHQTSFFLKFNYQKLRRSSYKDYDFSVIIPVYNHSIYLKKCIDSILTQVHQNFEVIIVDDCSTDPLVEIVLANYQNNPKVRIFRNATNSGISETQNFGVSQAISEWLVFVDCDDYLDKNALSYANHSLNIAPRAFYHFTDRFTVSDHGKTKKREIYGGHPLLFITGQNPGIDIQEGMIASHLKIINKAAYTELGGSNPKVSGVQDWDFALKYSTKYRFNYIPFPLYFYRWHSDSISASSQNEQIRKTNIVRKTFYNSKIDSYAEKSANIIGILKNINGDATTKNILDIFRSHYDLRITSTPTEAMRVIKNNLPVRVGSFKNLYILKIDKNWNLSDTYPITNKLSLFDIIVLAKETKPDVISKITSTNHSSYNIFIET